MNKTLWPLFIITMVVFLVAGAITVPGISFVPRAFASPGAELSTPSSNATLKVEIVLPQDGSTFSACQNFTVKAKVYNIGEPDALDVTATISIDAHASIVASPELWPRSYDGGGLDLALGVATDSLNNVIVTGQSYNATAGNDDYYTIKYDPAGNVLWARSYDGGETDWAYGVATDTLNDVIVTGCSENVTAGNWDYYTITYDPEGNVLWARSYDGGVDDYALGVATDSLNDVIVTGQSYNATAFNWDYYTIKYDPEGNVLWARSYDGGGGDEAYGVATDTLNNVIVTGPSSNVTAFNWDYCTIKYDPAGNVLWARSYDGGEPDEARGVATDALNNVIVTGYSYNVTSGDNDYYIVKYDPAGNLLWARSYHGGGDDWAQGVATDSLDNVIVTGYSRNVTAGNYDYYTIKYDPAGNVLWARSYDGVGHDWAYGVATDSLDNVIVTGSSYNATAGNYDYYTIKHTCLPTQSLGDIPGGGNATATWTLHCDSPGDSTITVTPAGTDGNTGEPISGANITPDSVIVHQQTAVLPEEEAEGGLSAGAIAGIAVGSCAAAAGIFFAIRKWVWKKRAPG